MSDKFSKYASDEDKFSKYAAPEDQQLDNEDYDQPEQMESKGLGGVASDAFQKALQGIFNLPSAIAGAPREAYETGKQIINEPKRAIQNVGAGFGELGHDILSAPGNVRDYLVKKDLVSKESPSYRLPESVLPKDFEYGEALGAEGSKPGDSLLRGAAKGIALSPLAGKLFAAIEEIPLTAKLASKPLRQAKKLVAERGINKISIPKNLFKESKDFLPKNLPSDNLLKKAMKGDYQSLFTLQSDLGKTARQLTKSSSGAERLHGFQAQDLRQRIIGSMKNHLEKEGHEDIAKLLGKGQNKYRQYKKLDEHIYRNLKKAGIPLTGLSALGYGYKKATSD